MNPLAIVNLVLGNWKLILLAGLVAFAGLQTYRVQGLKGEVLVLTVEKDERMKRDALRAAADQRNKERTDEEYAAAAARARVVVVRAKPAARIVAPVPPVAASSPETSGCVDRKLLLAGTFQLFEQLTGRFNQLIAEHTQRNSEQLSRIAQDAEAVAAAYRACRAYALNLSQGGNAPGSGEDGGDVGGVVDVNPLPVLRSLREMDPDQAERHSPIARELPHSGGDFIMRVPFAEDDALAARVHQDLDTGHAR